MLFLILTLVTAVSAKPSFIAVPADQITFVDLSSLHVRRVPRQALQPPPPQLPQLPQLAQLPQQLYEQQYEPIPIGQYQPQPVAFAPPPPEPEPQARLVQVQQPSQDTSASSNLPTQQLAERPPDFGEYIDFGAHTGDHGAFGWYADFPVNNQDDSGSGYRK